MVFMRLDAWVHSRLWLHAAFSRTIIATFYHKMMRR